MYNAIIAPIVVRPHSNADNIQLGTTVGYQVVVGLDVKDGDVGIFFPEDGQLSLEYCEANKLLKKDGGYFDDNRRVRAQKFRGEKSEGLWMPLVSLAYTGKYKDYVPGTLLTESNGMALCNKYETKRTRSQGQANRDKTRQKSNEFFKKHYDTLQWRFFKDQIPNNAYISLTEKLHGTSGRYGRVLEEAPRTWWQRLLRLQPKSTYQYLVGTRNTVLTQSKLSEGTSYYGNEQFRFDAVEGLTLHEGEILYFELVGSFVNKQSGVVKIMPPQPIKDKEVVKQYGKEMDYTYGLLPGATGLYIYRITRTSPEGVVTELSWKQVQARCHELGVNCVPELESWIVNCESQGGLEYTEQGVLNHTDGPSTLDERHIREGVVIRVESVDGTAWYKNKSFTFGVLEGYIKDDENYVDTEEAS